MKVLAFYIRMIIIPVRTNISHFSQLHSYVYNIVICDVSKMKFAVLCVYNLYALLMHIL